MLYLIATPIGNLADFSLRAVETIAECNYVLCEDTRRSSILLRHYKLDVPLKSYHKFNEEKRKDEILNDLKNGVKIALLSDAGTPCIADPGWRLVVACRQEGLDVTPIPGPCAAILALVASGMPSERFQFVGFLPKKKGQLRSLLLEILSYPGSTICYESPFRLKNSLQILAELAPERSIVIAREMTKKFEEFVEGTPQLLKDKWAKKPPKGEITIVI